MSSLNEEKLERDLQPANGEQTLEEALRTLWDKARSVSERLSELREQNRFHEERERTLERELEALRVQLVSRDQELKRIKAEHAQLLSAGDGNAFTAEEKESLKVRIRDLIAKINSHL